MLLATYRFVTLLTLIGVVKLNTPSLYSVAGCPEGAVKNIHGAVSAAASQGALGMTIANWAGVGHLTHPAISWPGIVAAGGLAWNADIRLVRLPV